MKTAPAAVSQRGFCSGGHKAHHPQTEHPACQKRYGAALGIGFRALSCFRRCMFACWHPRRHRQPPAHFPPRLASAIGNIHLTQIPLNCRPHRKSPSERTPYLSFAASATTVRRQSVHSAVSSASNHSPEGPRFRAQERVIVAGCSEADLALFVPRESRFSGGTGGMPQSASVASARTFERCGSTARPNGSGPGAGKRYNSDAIL